MKAVARWVEVMDEVKDEGKYEGKMIGIGAISPFVRRVQYRSRRCLHPRGSEHRRRESGSPSGFCHPWRRKTKNRWPNRLNRSGVGIPRRYRASCSQRRPWDRPSRHSRSPSGTPCRTGSEVGIWRGRKSSRHRQLVRRVSRGMGQRSSKTTYVDCQRPSQPHSDAKSTW